MRFDMGRVDYLRIGGSPTPGELPKNFFPNATPSPSHKAVINGGMWAIYLGAIAPATATPQDMYDTAEHAPVVYSLDAAHVCRQMWLDPPPLLVAQPEQLSAHRPAPTESMSYSGGGRLMSFDPRADSAHVDAYPELRK
jgi:hypothetical protein